MAERSFHMLPGGNVLGDLDTIVADLERCDVLAAASRADLESLAGLLVPFAVPAGTVLLRRGDVAEHVLLLTSGRARVAFGEQGAQKTAAVAKGSILGEMALLRGTRRSATSTAVTETRGLKGGRAAFARLLAIPEVLEKVVIQARQRLVADLVPVPVTLRDGTAAGLRPVFPGDQYALVRGEPLFSVKTRYQRFLAAVHMTPALARYLAEVDYVDHFAWAAVDSTDVPVGGARLDQVGHSVPWHEFLDPALTHELRHAGHDTLGRRRRPATGRVPSRVKPSSWPAAKDVHPERMMSVAGHRIEHRRILVNVRCAC